MGTTQRRAHSTPIPMSPALAAARVEGFAMGPWARARVCPCVPVPALALAGSPVCAAAPCVGLCLARASRGTWRGRARLQPALLLVPA